MKMLPNWIGFDSLFNEIDRVSRSMKVPNWPPYNVKKIDEDHYVIEMAVAGFGSADIDLEMSGAELTVSGRSSAAENVEYIWKGIADRAFALKFPLADTIKVQNAEMVNGMLRIFLESFIPEDKKTKKIAVKSL